MEKKFFLYPPNEYVITNKIMSNDRYTKYAIECTTNGSLIIINDPCKYDARMAPPRESYESYCNNVKLIPLKNYQWAYNIIDGTAEQNSIVYQDDMFIFIPDYVCDFSDIQNQHYLAIVKDKKLASLRSLTGEHIKLLEHILHTSLNELKKIYGYDHDKYRVYIHYPPSTYQLHVHFNLLSNTKFSTSVEYTHDLRQVIYNLSLCSEYYRNIDL